MAKTTDPTTIVIVDDELHNLMWLVDYVGQRGLTVKTASNANEATEILSEGICRAAVIDLNIPMLEPLVKSISDKGTLYAKFPGLYVASFARNRGYRDRQVVIYSVHKDPAVAEESRKLGCTYIIKGRPKEIKAELEDVLSFDPTTAVTK
jgi:CheY-like chemotaxis protein